MQRECCVITVVKATKKSVKNKFLLIEPRGVLNALYFLFQEKPPTEYDFYTERAFYKPFQ